MKRDPDKRPLVRKWPNGKVWAWTNDIAAYCGRSRHDNFLVAVRKVIEEDPHFAAKNYRTGTYKARNNQTRPRFRMTREGFQAMCRKLHGIHEYEVLYLDAYDLCEHENRVRLEKVETPDLDPATIPDDPGALEPVKPTIVLDLTKEPGGTEDHARRIIEVSGAVETPELVAEVAHALPGPLIGEDAIHGPVRPFVFDDPDGQSTVRVMDRDGEAWFVALDVCRSLGITNASHAVGRLDADEKADIVINDVAGRPQGALGVNEAGLYSLIMTSRKPAAKRFKRWVTHEVLPQIRQTGSYGRPERPELPQDYLSALKALVVSEEQRAALASANAAQAQQVAALSQEKADLVAKVEEQDQFLEAYRRLANAEGLSLVSNIAKVLHIPQGEMFDRLHKSGYTFRRRAHDTSSPWLAYDKWVKKGLFDHKIWQQPMPDGTKKDRPQLYATRKGVEVIAMLFGQDDSGQGRLSLGMH